MAGPALASPRQIVSKALKNREFLLLMPLTQRFSRAYSGEMWCKVGKTPILW